MDEYNQTFVISEAAHWDSQQQFKKTKPIAIKETNIGEGWVRVELAWAVRVWLEGRERLHTLHVACRTCQVNTIVLVVVNIKQYLIIRAVPVMIELAWPVWLWLDIMSGTYLSPRWCRVATLTLMYAVR